MPTEYETRGKCVICGKVRSEDWLWATPAGYVCETPPYDPDLTEQQRIKKFRRTHSKTTLILAENKRHLEATKAIMRVKGDHW